MPVLDLTCACGTEFKRAVTRARSGSTYRFYCSRECQRTYQVYTTAPAFSKSGPYRKVHTCVGCGETFYASHPSVRYCDQSCKDRTRNARTADRYRATVVGHAYSVRDKRRLKIGMLEHTKTCGICSTKFDLNDHGSIHLDHDHKTGKIRGLLCFHCNAGLGHLRDDVARLRAAIAYLQKDV